MRVTPTKVWPLLCVLTACGVGERELEPGRDDLDGIELLQRELGPLEVLRVSPELALARSASSALVATLAPGSVRLESTTEGGWQASMRLQAYGRPGHLEPVDPAQLEVDGARATLSSGDVSEWYDTGEQGLMHGFTIERAPAKEGDTLRLEVAVEGAQVRAAGPRALTLTSAGETLRYERLMAWDARGRWLEASMRPSAAGFVVDVATPADLAYPVTVDPVFVRTFTLDGGRAALDAAGDRFGSSVDVDGDLLVVGAPFDDFAGADAGAFYTYQWDPSAGWVFVSRQSTPGVAPGDNTGWAVALEGQRLAVGSPGRLGGNGGAFTYARGGRVSVFELQSGTWVHQNSITDIVDWDDHELGKSVALQHPYVFGGAPGSNTGTNVFSGAVLLFNYVTNAQGRLEARGLVGDGALLGSSLAVADDVLFAGAPGDERMGRVGAGSVYFWVRDPTEFGTLGWGIPFFMTSDNSFDRGFDARVDGRFGQSIAATPAEVVVGEPGLLPTMGSPTLPGRAYVFGINSSFNTTSLKQTLEDTSPVTQFGASVAIDGDLLLVGAPGASGGKVQAYSRLGTNPWSVTQAPMSLPGAAMGDGFGAAMALSGDRAVVGAPGRDGLASDAGEVHVVEVDDPPVPRPAPTVTVAEDGSIDVTVTASDPDTLPTSLVYTFQSNPPNGVISIAGDVITYSPDADFSGMDTISYEVSDGTNTTQGSVDVNVTAVNDAPVATPQAVVVDEDTPRAIVFAATDVDTAAASLLYDLARDAGGDAAANGSVSGSPPNVTYTPDPRFSGTDAITFLVSDGQLSSSATVTITVRPVNDPPVAPDVTASTDEDTPVVISIVATDEDTDDASLRYMLVDQGGGLIAANGTVRGSFPDLTYTPNQDFTGQDTFEYSVSDGEFTEPATVTVTVAPVNDAPTATAASYDVVEDTPFELTLAGADPDAEPSLGFAITAAPEHGSLDLSDLPAVTYTPAPNYVGADAFEFTASDASETSAPARVELTVEAVDDPPVALPQRVEVDEDAEVSVALAGEDVEGSALTFSLIDPPSHGAVERRGLSNALYTPEADYSGEDTFTFVVNDGANESAPGVVTVVVRPVNDAPVVRDLTLRTPAGQPVVVTLAGEDVDGDALTYAVDDPSRGAITSQEGDTVTYDPGDFVGQVRFTYAANDGAVDSVAPATVTITVGVVGDAPPRERPDLVGCSSAPARSPAGLPLLAFALVSLGLLSGASASSESVVRGSV